MQFSEELIKVFDYMGEKFGIAIDWSNANAIPYLKELCGRFIDWEIATSIALMVIVVILVVVAIILYKVDMFYDELFIVVSTVVAFVVVGFQIFDILKCIYLPELQIYQYIINYM